MRIGYDAGYFDIRGLSTDTKPASGAVLSSHSAMRSSGVLSDVVYTRVLDVGDTFYEADTGDHYMWTGTTWRKQ